MGFQAQLRSSFFKMSKSSLALVGAGKAEKQAVDLELQLHEKGCSRNKGSPDRNEEAGTELLLWERSC